MSDKKISELTNITGANLADADEFVVVDTSASETKAITWAELKEGLDTGTGFVRITGDTMTGNLSFGDNDKAVFGAGSDLQIYHSGSGSFISEVGTGNLFIQGESAVAIQNNSSQSMAIFKSGADVQLKYATTTRLATTSTGIDVTGRAEVDGLTSSASIISTSNSNSLGGTTFTSAISGTSASFSASITASGNSNSFGNSSFGTVTADGLTVESGTSGITVDTSVSLSPEIKPSQALSDLIVSGTGNGGHLKFKTDDTDRVKIDGGTGDISFYEDTGTTPKFFWDASAESLGIGTDSPSAGAVGGKVVHVQNSGATASIRVDRSDATTAGTLSMTSGSTTNGLYGTGAKPMGFSTDGTERMRIDSSGNLMVGLTDITDATSRTYGNAFSGSSAYANWTSWGNGTHTHAAFRNATNQVGSITTNSTTTTYNITSDYRLKENVVELTGATDRIKQIPVHRFNFIADADTTVDGFLAHEVQAIVPEAVVGTKDAVDADGNPVYQGIDQSKLVPLLTAALQEALGRIETLEAEVAALKA